MENRKIICIVQARMNSERLPGKVLKPILGIPMTKIVLDRLSRSKYIDRQNNTTGLVLATTTNPEDDPLAEMAEAAGYPVFRGDEKNVLKRYCDCVEHFGGDVVLRVTGDCPLVDPTLIDSLLSTYLAYDYDYMRLDVPTTFIRGFDGEVFSREAMLRACSMVDQFAAELNANTLTAAARNNASVLPASASVDASASISSPAATSASAPVEASVPVSSLDSSAADHAGASDRLRQYREHVTYFIYQHPEHFRTHYLEGLPLYNKPYRLCVDTPEDFILVTNIFEHFDDIYVGASEAALYLTDNQRLTAANDTVVQRY